MSEKTRFYVGEFGTALRMGTSFNLLTADVLTVTLYKPDATAVTGTGTITIGGAETKTNSGTFAANEWLDYQLASGELDTDGEWEARVTHTVTGSATIPSSRLNFPVDP